MSATRDLWAHLFGDRHDTLELVSVKPDKWTTAEYGHFSYPEQLDQAEKWVQNHSVGRNVYHGAQLLLSPKSTTGKTPRTKDNVSAVLALWADLDGSPLPDDLPRPTAIVESSPGKMHCYWRLTRPVQPAEAEQLSKRIAYAIQDDLSGWDLTQLLRVPGTTNYKYEVAQPVTLTHLDDSIRYDPKDLAKVLPPLASDSVVPESSPAVGTVSLADAEILERARKRNPKFQRLWDGDLSDYPTKQHPEGDPSDADAGACSILAFWAQKDAATIERCWLAMPGLKRDKLDRDDYRKRTIDYAISKCTATYSGRTLLTELKPSDSDPQAWLELKIDPSAAGPENGHCSEHCDIYHRQATPADPSPEDNTCIGCHHCLQVPLLTERVARLGNELARLRDRENARQLLRKSGWSGEERVALEHLAHRVDKARQDGLDEVRLFYAKETEQSGVTPGTLTRVVKRLEKHQLDGEAVPIPVVRDRTINGKPQVRLTIDRSGSYSGDLVALAAIRRNDPQQGGARTGPCKRHPDAVPHIQIIEQQLTRTVRQSICPIDGQILTTEHDPIKIVDQRVIQVEPPSPFQDETEADQEQLTASEAYYWQSSPAPPFHHGTEAHEPIEVPDVVTKGNDIETDSQPGTVRALFHDETILPPLTDDPYWPEYDWATKERLKTEREQLLAKQARGGAG